MRHEVVGSLFGLRFLRELVERGKLATYAHLPAGAKGKSLYSGSARSRILGERLWKEA